MATKTKYCEAGHAFVIDGIMAVGNTITVTVVPNTGYEFVKWSDGVTDNPREIYIEECGITYYGIFRDNCGPGCDKEEIFNSLVRIVDSRSPQIGEYEETDITCETINSTLGVILGVNN